MNRTTELWLVLVLMALDCLPVLAKLMSGSSAYDQLIAVKGRATSAFTTTTSGFREETATVDKEVGIYLSETRKRDRMRLSPSLVTIRPTA